jgi:hypothetical protein
MIVWDPENAEIVSSIRFACMSDLMEGEKDN